MTPFAVSSWSLDGLLQAGMPLVDLPSQMAEHGLDTLELCHFHLPDTAAATLQDMRAAMAAAGVKLSTLLIDTGDIAAPDPAIHTADVATIEGWIDIAVELGAERVRISAGKQAATPDVIRRSAEHLRACAERASSRGLRTITENWQTTGQQPGDLLAILDGCGGTVGLCADTGNAEDTPDKYATLEQLLPRASSVHFKARYRPDGTVDEADVQRCTALMREASFAGPITLIYGGKRDEWAEIERLREALQPLS